MPAVWLGLPIIAALAIVIWLLTRRVRQGSDASSPAVSRPFSGEAAPATAEPPPGAPARSDAAGAGALSAGEIFNKLHELAFEVTPLAAPGREAYEAIASTAGAVLDTAATELRHAPRRPLLLPQLLSAMRNDEVSRRDLAKIIARDPALAGNLLKLANSSFYRISERPVESIDRAVALLGTDGIRSLVATALVQPVFHLSKQEFPHFPEVVWEHTYRAAAAAEAHAAIVEDTDPFAAQLLGLTMGLGAIVVFRVALEQYATQPGKPDPSVIAALLDVHTAPVARRIAASWELSDRILTALADQVSAAQAPDRTSLGRSLYFGRLIGALAVLQVNKRVGEDAAKSTMLASGATGFQFERIWARLTGSVAGNAERRPDRQRSSRDAGRPRR
jgi:HD-like signal output (HDOD) protein